MTRIVLTFILVLISCISCSYYTQNKSESYKKRETRSFVNILDDKRVANCPALNRQISLEQEFSNYAKSRNSVYFDFDSDEIKGEGVERVNKMIFELSKVLGVKVLLRGYTDRVGEEKYNNKLSIKRIKAVKKALVDSGLIEQSNIIIEIAGYGEYDPLISTNTIENNSASRRVDMYIVKNNELETKCCHWFGCRCSPGHQGPGIY
jgi:outer membrane protein OmpA-like peptidoglycan-associated protein